MTVEYGRKRSILDRVDSPASLKALSLEECDLLAEEMRDFIVEAVSKTGGHLGSNLGAVELTIALHRVFRSPDDVLIFDTGHQAYVHKLITGRRLGFAQLRQEGGLSGYPNRRESPHDVVENSHASTALSWAHGIAVSRRLQGGSAGNHVVAVVGDGALTGGMAYEALNNLGHAGERVLIVLNDNGRSYAPTISKLSGSLTQLRLDPRYVQLKRRVKEALDDVPALGMVAGRSFRGLTSALREIVEPHVFFEALGVRYTGPLDGHDVGAIEQALVRASTWPGPIVLHVLTRKGKGYAPAEDDEIACLHDLKVSSVRPSQVPEKKDTSKNGLGQTFGTGVRDEGALNPSVSSGESYSEAFSKALIREAELDSSIVAITAAMPGPTGLLSFKDRFPERFFDVGIAEQHAMTAAAGMASGGLRPVVCIYSTFLSRCFDQWNLDAGLHRQRVVVVADRAGVTGDDGPSHHGLYDMVQALSIPGCALFCPSEPAEIAPLFEEALRHDEGPALLRYPKTPCEEPLGPPGEGLFHRVLCEGDSDIVVVGVGKLARAAKKAGERLATEGLHVTVVDPRVIRPEQEGLVEVLSNARLVVTAEDGLRHGGAGSYLAARTAERAREMGSAGPRFVVLGVPTAYFNQAKPDVILSRLGLDPEGVASSVLEAAERFGLTGGRLRTRPLPQAAQGGYRPSTNGNGLSPSDGHHSALARREQR